MAPHHCNYFQGPFTQVHTHKHMNAHDWIYFLFLVTETPLLMWTIGKTKESLDINIKLVYVYWGGGTTTSPKTLRISLITEVFWVYMYTVHLWSNGLYSALGKRGRGERFSNSPSQAIATSASHLTLLYSVQRCSGIVRLVRPSYKLPVPPLAVPLRGGQGSVESL